MWPNPEETADLVTFTAETLNRKLNFLCSVIGNVAINVNTNSSFWWFYVYDVK